jgi:hypothetical protein
MRVDFVTPLRSGWRFFARATMLMAFAPLDNGVEMPIMAAREPTPGEKAGIAYVGLLSAVDHLARGITHSGFKKDSYLSRLQTATDGERLKALEYYGHSLADYSLWCSLYGESMTAH